MTVTLIEKFPVYNMGQRPVLFEENWYALSKKLSGWFRVEASVNPFKPRGYTFDRTTVEILLIKTTVIYFDDLKRQYWKKIMTLLSNFVIQTLKDFHFCYFLKHENKDCNQLAKRLLCLHEKYITTYHDILETRHGISSRSQNVTPFFILSRR